MIFPFVNLLIPLYHHELDALALNHSRLFFLFEESHAWIGKSLARRLFRNESKLILPLTKSAISIRRFGVRRSRFLILSVQSR
jgi:hypothetical protein